MQQRGISGKKIFPDKRRGAFPRQGMFFLAAVICLSLFSASPALSEYKDKAGPDAAGAASPLGPSTGGASGQDSTDCQNTGADLSGTFTNNPCNLTSKNKELKATRTKADGTTEEYTFDPRYYGGEQVVNYLEDWWRNELLPALRGMTAQINSSRIDQTRQLGSSMDAQNVVRSTTSEQKQELDSKRRNAPSELACATGTQAVSMTKASGTSKGITKVFKDDINKRSANAPGTAAATGPAADQKVRWDEYCAEFEDPDNNNGVSVCPEQSDDDPEEGTATIPNGDINVDGVLLDDTIDITDPHEYAAAWALLRNLIQPTVTQKIPDTVIASAAGHEWILKQQHLESIRNIATDVVTSIIGRRTAIPSDPPEPIDYSVEQETFTADDGSGGSGSGGGTATLSRAQEKLANQPTTPAFVNDPTPGMTYCQKFSGWAAQDMASVGSAAGGWRRYGEMDPSPVHATPAEGDLVYFVSKPHLEPKGCAPKSCKITGFSPEGCGKLSINNNTKIPPGQPGGGGYASNCTSYTYNTPHCGDKCTAVTFYGHTGVFSGNGKFISVISAQHPEKAIQEGNMWANVLGAVTPLSNGDPIPRSPPKPPAELIQDIRRKAGVVDYSENPSYNEIMQAMTKERFFDPEYFIRIQDNVGAIKQEQTAINAFITLQYQDIYEMQERINALLAARASLKLEADKKPSQIESAPMK